jgi:hypothetical protein
MSGQAHFVLPKHDDARYIALTTGVHFGIIDIVGSVLANPDFDLQNWMGHKESIKR